MDFSETSQIVSLFTRECGRVDAIAKGVYREKGSFQGPFDLGVLYEVVFVDRKSEGLAVLTESVVVDGFRGLRSRWYRHVGACHVLELLRCVTSRGTPDEALFDLARDTMEQLSASEEDRAAAVRVRFDLASLLLLGLLAHLGACVACGREWPGGGRPAFVSPRAGGLLCSSCRSAAPVPGTVVPGGVVGLLVALSGSTVDWDEVGAVWPRHGRLAGRVAGQLRDYMLETEFLALRSESVS